MSLTKPCVVCKKEMGCAVNDWTTFQPDGGGEIKLIFAWGSNKFDLNIDSTEFRGIICDECGERLIPNMEMVT